MVAIGLILLLVAALAWGGFAMQKFKGGRLDKAPFVKTGDAASKGAAVAGDKGAISAEGKVAHKELLLSPVTATECLYYDVSVVAHWKSGDTSKSQGVMDEKKACEFSIDDGTGPVSIDASKGGDLDTKQTFSKKKGLGLKAVVTGADAIEFGDHNFRIIPGQKVKGVKIPMNADYQVTEKVVLPTEKLYVCGKWNAEASNIGSPSWTSLIMTSKSREELMGATAKTQGRAKMVGMITTPAAILFLILGAVFGGPSKDKTKTPEPSNAAVEAPADKAPAAPAEKPADKPAAKPGPAATASGGGSAPAPAPSAPAAAPAAAPEAAPAPAAAAPAPAAGGAKSGGKTGGKRR